MEHCGIVNMSVLVSSQYNSVPAKWRWYHVFGTGQRAVMPCGWGVKAGMVCVWVAGKTVWSPCYTRPYLSALEVRRATKRYTNPRLLYFTLLCLSWSQIWRHVGCLSQTWWYSGAHSGLREGAEHPAIPSRHMRCNGLYLCYGSFCCTAIELSI